MCIDIVELCLGVAHGQISSIFDRVIDPQYYNGGVLSFNILLNVNYVLLFVILACSGIVLLTWYVFYIWSSHL